MVSPSLIQVIRCALLLLVALGLSACAADSSFRTGAAPEFYDESPGSSAAADDDDDVGGDDDDDPGDDLDLSGVSLVSTVPEAGSNTHLYRDPIRLAFSGYAGSSVVSLYDADGYSVPSQRLWRADMSACELWPSSPLVPDSPYRVVISLGDAAIEFEFTTSRIGLPVLPADVDGRVFALDFSAAESSASPKLASLLRGASGSATWLLSPSAEDDGSLSFDLAFALANSSGFEQSSCSPTSALGSVSDSAGDLEPDGSYFFVSGSGLALPLDDQSLVLDFWAISGDFGPEGDQLAGVNFVGELVASSLGLATVGEACDLAELEFGSLCIPCLGDSTQSCIPIDLGGISGSQSSQEIILQSGVVEEACEGELSGLLSCSLATVPPSSSAFASLLFLFLAGLIRRR
jgi:MYXO-CTERM domain-containing protein